MGVKVTRGGKYGNNAGAPQQQKKPRREVDYDLEMKEITKNGKSYYILMRVDTGQVLKSAPEWRNSKSPIKWAEKHGFNVINRLGD